MITVARDGSGDYTAIQAAVDAIPRERGETPVRILVRAGEYREKVVVYRDNVVITGEDPERTVLVWNGCAKDRYPDGTEKGTFLSATLMVTGSNVTIENLTIMTTRGTVGSSARQWPYTRPGTGAYGGTAG